MTAAVKCRSNKFAGFTLIELVIAMLVISILAAIAYPSYVKSVTRSKRRAAEACLSSYATYMERFYTSNLRYDTDTGGVAITLPSLECATTQAADYQFRLTAKAQSTYTLQAIPQNAQATRDASCGSLTLNEIGHRGVSTSTDPTQCW